MKIKTGLPALLIGLILLAWLLPSAAYATEEPELFHVICQADPVESGVVWASPQECAAGRSVVVNISVVEGSTLTRFLVDGVEYSPAVIDPRRYIFGFVMPSSDVVVRAEFNGGHAHHRVLVECDPPEGGCIELRPNESAFVEGATVSAEIHPAPGAEFKNLYVDGEPVTTQPSSLDGDARNYTFTMPDRDVSLRAVFTSRNRTYVWLNGDGSELWRVTIDISKVPFTDKTPVKAEDEDYTYVFDHWEKASEVGWTITYRPVFTAVPKTKHHLSLTAIPEAGGTVSGGGDYAEGASVRIGAEANAGYRFTGWQVLSGGVNAQDNVLVMPGRDVSLAARFEALPVEYIRILDEPAVGYWMCYKGKAFTIHGRIEDDDGQLATVVPGRVAAIWGDDLEGETLAIEDGAFSYTVTPTQTGDFLLHFFYFDADGSPRFSVPTRIFVVNNDIDDIYLDAAEAKTEYAYGEKLDLTNLYVALHWSDGSEERVPVTEDMIVTPFYNTRLGQQRLRVEYRYGETYSDLWVMYHEVTVTQLEQSFTVSFDTGGVCAPPDPVQSVWSDSYGAILGEHVWEEPGGPDEYAFQGWYLDPEHTTAAEYMTHLTRDVTLYAAWEGPRPLIEAVALSVARPTVGAPLPYFYEWDEESDTLEEMGIAAQTSSPMRISAAFWHCDMPYDPDDPYCEDAMWSTFQPDADYALLVYLEVDGDSAYFKGHAGGEPFALTVNGSRVDDGSWNTGPDFAVAVYRFHISARSPIEPDFILPASLTEIGEEAFAHGAFLSVQLPARAVRIGPRAFADCPNLSCVYIPEQTTEIADDAFAGTVDLAVIAKRGSFAETYARTHGFAYIQSA